MLRRLVLTVLTVSGAMGLTVLSGLTAAGSAAAAPCQRLTVAESSEASMAVFSGEVTSVERQDRPAGQPGAYFLHEVTVTRVYQGEVTTESVQVRTDIAPPSAEECTLGKLGVGTTYMFFVGGDGAPWTASGDSRTQPSNDDLVTQVERLLGAGRPPVEPAAEEAVFTPVDVGDPESFGRLAAPGAALVLVGLLGLVLVRWRAGRG